MVRRVLDIVYREVRGLHQAAYVLGLFAFGSQILALIRDRLLAHEFGAGATLDIYYAAFRIPDLLYVLFASTLSVYVLIPFVARAQKGGGDSAARRLLSSIFTLFLLAYSSVALVLFIATPVISVWLFPGVVDHELLNNVTRILLLQPLFLGVSSLFGVVTQLGHRFVLYAISPLIYNIGIIFGIAVLYPIFGLVGVALGVVMGAVGHMLIQLPLVRQSTLSLSLVRNFDWVALRSILALSIPRALTLSFNQIVLLILVSFASLMTVGSVSVFQFAYNLQSVPLAIIGVSYSVAAFPLLAQLFAKGERNTFTLHILTALRHIMFWSIPISVLIIVLRAHVVRIVLGSGAFDWSDTRLTAAVLAVLVLGLLAHGINLLVIRAFYAGGYTRTPFYTALLGGFLAVASAYYFYAWYISHIEIQHTVSDMMRLSNVIGSEVIALAFGYTLAVIVQAIVLLIMLQWTFSVRLAGLWQHFARCLLAALFGGGATYVTLNFLVSGINPETFVGIFLQGTISGLVGVVGVGLAYAGLQTPELYEIYNSFQRKLFRTDVVAPQEDVL